MMGEDEDSRSSGDGEKLWQEVECDIQARRDDLRRQQQQHKQVDLDLKQQMMWRKDIVVLQSSDETLESPIRKCSRKRKLRNEELMGIPKKKGRGNRHPKLVSKKRARNLHSDDSDSDSKDLSYDQVRAYKTKLYSRQSKAYQRRKINGYQRRRSFVRNNFKTSFHEESTQTNMKEDVDAKKEIKTVKVADKSCQSTVVSCIDSELKSASCNSIQSVCHSVCTHATSCSGFMPARTLTCGGIAQPLIFIIDPQLPWSFNRNTQQCCCSNRSACSSRRESPHDPQSHEPSCSCSLPQHKVCNISNAVLTEDNSERGRQQVDFSANKAVDESAVEKNRQKEQPRMPKDVCDLWQQQISHLNNLISQVLSSRTTARDTTTTHSTPIDSNLGSGSTANQPLQDQDSHPLPRKIPEDADARSVLNQTGSPAKHCQQTLQVATVCLSSDSRTEKVLAVHEIPPVGDCQKGEGVSLEKQCSDKESDKEQNAKGTDKGEEQCPEKCLLVDDSTHIPSKVESERLPNKEPSGTDNVQGNAVESEDKSDDLTRDDVTNMSNSENSVTSTSQDDKRNKSPDLFHEDKTVEKNAPKASSANGLIKSCKEPQPDNEKDETDLLFEDMDSTEWDYILKVCEQQEVIMDSEDGKSTDPRILFRKLKACRELPPELRNLRVFRPPPLRKSPNPSALDILDDESKRPPVKELEANTKVEKVETPQCHKLGKGSKLKFKFVDSIASEPDSPSHAQDNDHQTSSKSRKQVESAPGVQTTTKASTQNRRKSRSEGDSGSHASPASSGLTYEKPVTRAEGVKRKLDLTVPPPSKSASKGAKLEGRKKGSTSPERSKKAKGKLSNPMSEGPDVPIIAEENKISQPYPEDDCQVTQNGNSEEKLVKDKAGRTDSPTSSKTGKMSPPSLPISHTSESTEGFAASLIKGDDLSTASALEVARCHDLAVHLLLNPWRSLNARKTMRGFTCPQYDSKTVVGALWDLRSNADPIAVVDRIMTLQWDGVETSVLRAQIVLYVMALSRTAPFIIEANAPKDDDDGNSSICSESEKITKRKSTPLRVVASRPIFKAECIAGLEGLLLKASFEEQCHLRTWNFPKFKSGRRWAIYGPLAYVQQADSNVNIKATYLNNTVVGAYAVKNINQGEIITINYSSFEKRLSK